MNLQFQNTVGGSKYSFIDENLRPAFKKAVEKAGRKNIIFVEGYDDEVIYGILYQEYLEKLCFIDVSFEAEKVVDSALKSTGGCEQVKKYLQAFVKHFSETKHFYGVIDRDLKTDKEVKTEMEKLYYDGRLFIFFERYTLENYLIESDILFEFLKGQSTNQSTNHKKLISILKKGTEKLEKEVITPILTCLIDIAAVNLTIRFFAPSQKFLEDTVSCKEGEIEKRIVQKLNQFQKEDVLSKFSKFKKELIEKKEPLKFASAKSYFSYQFNQKLKKQIQVNIQLNNHKAELARILKERELPKDFQDLLNLINSNDNKYKNDSTPKT
jgi:hypothetical protein